MGWALASILFNRSILVCCAIAKINTVGVRRLRDFGNRM